MVYDGIYMNNMIRMPTSLTLMMMSVVAVRLKVLLTLEGCTRPLDLIYTSSRESCPVALQLHQTRSDLVFFLFLTALFACRSVCHVLVANIAPNRVRILRILRVGVWVYHSRWLHELTGTCFTQDVPAWLSQHRFGRVCKPLFARRADPRLGFAVLGALFGEVNRD